MPRPPLPAADRLDATIVVNVTAAEKAALIRRHGPGKVGPRLRALALRDIDTPILSHDERLLRDGGDVTIREALGLVGKSRKGEEDK